MPHPRYLLPALPLLFACTGGGAADDEPPLTAPLTTTSTDGTTASSDKGVFAGLEPRRVLRHTNKVDNVVPMTDGTVAFVGPTPTQLQLGDGSTRPFSSVLGGELLVVMSSVDQPQLTVQGREVRACRGARPDELIVATNALVETDTAGFLLAPDELLVFRWSAQDGAQVVLRESGAFVQQLSCSPTGWVALGTSEVHRTTGDFIDRVRTIAPDDEVVLDYELVMNDARALIGPDGELVVTGWYTDGTVGHHRPRHVHPDSLDALAIAIDAGGQEMWQAAISGGSYDISRSHQLTEDGRLVWVAGEAWDGGLIVDGTGTQHQPTDVYERTYVVALDLQTGALLANGHTEVAHTVLDVGGLTVLTVDTVNYPGLLHDLPNEMGSVLFVLDEQLQPLAADTLVPEAQLLTASRFYRAVAHVPEGVWVVGPVYLPDDDIDNDLPVVAALVPYDWL